MATELIPLKSGQHLITFVPKLSTELPFFNLTSRRKDIPKVIKYEGVDVAGHPIRWEVYQNTSKEIGAPGVEAHQVWYLLIKPAIDEARRPDITIPEIVPLGKVRECLRKVGWAAGGRQQRDLIQALRQISFAGCVADLWMPTGDLDEEGKQRFLQIKGSFSRLSVYAIGEYHVTDAELARLDFKFNLEDILYIRLDPLEAKLQQFQDQRVIDNQYLFSVKPASRRWYELMAGKIFGTIKNKAPFCEIRYSWYIKHHHTLKQHYERRRVVEQMNEVVQDHLALGYISNVEYRKIKEPDQGLDFIIRYYPGEGAKESIARIQGHIYRRRKSLKQLPEVPEPAETAEEAAGQGSAPTGKNNASTSLLTGQDELLMQQLITEFGITPIRALDLITHKQETTREQLAAWPYRNLAPKNKAGWIIEAIEKNYQLPDEYLIEKQKEADRQKTIEAHNRIAACELCRDANGFRRIRTERYPSGAMRKCTHDPETEAQYETA